MDSNNQVEQFNDSNLKVIPFKETNGMTNATGHNLKVPIDNTAITLLDPEILHSDGNT